MASRLIQHLRKTVLSRDGAGLTDDHLLGCFIQHRDEDAFAALVRRYGPMVWGVCRRLLRNHHDAEDAFQATFLVLARKAASIVPREMVANWLYGVARQTALKARQTAAKRQARERQVTDMPEPQALRKDPWDDFRPLLDEGLARLPAKYRLLLVLCDLEGRPRREVARQLEMAEGTLSSRLTTARRLLAKRLARHGLAVSSGSLAAVGSGKAAAACVPASLVGSTVNAAMLVAAGKAAAGLVPANVAVLAEGVLKTMMLSKLETAAAVLLAMSLVAFGGGALTHRMAGAGQTGGEAARVEAATRLPAPARTEANLGDVKLGQKPEDYNGLFDAVLEVLGDDFQVAYANRFDGLIETANLLEKPIPPPRSATGRPATRPTHRRRAIVSLMAADEGGFLVSVRVFKEAQKEAVKGERNLPSPAAEAGWEPAGRDIGLEQAILRRLADRDRKERTEGAAGTESERGTDGA
jgi:RNA polymerase sigma factor (sigma-70 family)